MSIIIGSARIDERGKLSGGKAGDQKQTGIDDYRGEVSMQAFYIHRKGWYLFSWKNLAFAEKCAKAMKDACNNKHIGYDQNQRLGVWNQLQAGKTIAGISTDTETDCSALVRVCIKQASGVDIGNQTTGTLPDALKKSGLFKDPIKCTSASQCTLGGILVTQVRGHTAIVVIAPSASTTKPAASTAAKPAATKPTAGAPAYQIGHKYTTQVNLQVRTGPGKVYPAKKHSALTADGQKHDPTKKGVLEAGTAITCQETRTESGNIWMRCPSGWIAAYFKTSQGYKTYVK